MPDNEPTNTGRYATITEAMLREGARWLGIPYKKLSDPLPPADPAIVARNRAMVFGRPLLGLTKPWINPVKKPT